jgi:hypothetical protein
MKVAACGKWFDYLNMMPIARGLDFGEACRRI